MKEKSKKDKHLTILITGGSSGIGYQAVLKLISLGHNVILPCRNISRANKVLTNVFNDFKSFSSKKGTIYTPLMDLSDLRSIDSFCSEFKKRRVNIDILILNAGLQYTGSKTPRRSIQGIELTFAVNHLSHFYLTQNLLPLINRSNDSKIIITSSEVHNPMSSGGKVGAKASLGDLSGLASDEGFEMIDGNQFNADKAYKDSKLCNILFAKELTNRLNKKSLSITVIAWAPGLVISRANEVLTNIYNQSPVQLSKKGDIYTPIMDLSDLKSIDSLCSELKIKRVNIDVLILNAGLQYTGSKTPRLSTQGIELTFAVNHLSHFYLTQKILPLIDKKNDPKIIITSSEVHNPNSGGGKVGAKASLGNLKGLESGVGFEMID